MTDAPPPPRIFVIGAGVIGTAIAHDLQRRGHAVTLIDRDAPGRGASFGNMASIAVTEFLPAARPSVLRRMPGWLLDPDGPIRLPPHYLPRLIPWGLRFLAAACPARRRAIEAHGAALCQRALADTGALLRDIGAEDLISDTGCIALYADDAALRADRHHHDLLDRYGFDHRPLDRGALRNLVPDLSPEISRGVYFPDNRSLRDPHRYVTRIAERFTARGGQIVQGAVQGIGRRHTGIALRLDDGRRLNCDRLVLCAGAHTGALAKQLGEPIPLESERGYHTQIMAPGLHLDHALIWPARAFMITPTAGGIRVGGTVEFGGLDAPPDFNRARVTARHAKAALPGLRLKKITEWMGHRPALPDTIPILSASATTPGVFYATGHGHLGLTLAATSARLMGQLVTGDTPDLDLSPYRVDRF